MTKELKIKEKRIKKLLSELELKLRDLFKDNLKKIILYGSYARGTYDDESDIDVMVLIDGVNKKEYKKYITDIRLELVINYSILPSITVEIESEYYKNIDIQFLFKNIESEGVELYAA